MRARTIEEVNPLIAERSAEVEILGKKYQMILSSAATIAITRKFGGIDKLGASLSKEGAESYENTIWLITLLCNQSIALQNFLNPGAEEPLLTEQFVALATTPEDVGKFAPAIAEAVSRGAGRKVDSVIDESEKNVEAG